MEMSERIEFVDLLDSPLLKYNKVSPMQDVHQSTAPLIEWTGNPLECLGCRRQMQDPVNLSACRHVFCAKCIPQTAEKSIVCPLCQKLSEAANPDPLVSYLVASTSARADDCANCDRVSPPMFYCDTCKQTLCVECKNTTHEAKMFSSHRLVHARERVATSALSICALHQQPLIMFDSDDKRLMCLSCFRGTAVEQRQHCLDLDVASEVAKEKLARSAQKIRRCCEELVERATLQRQQLTEIESQYRKDREQLFNICQQMIDRMIVTRDSLLAQLDEQEMLQKKSLESEQKSIIAQLPSINLYLLAASILVSSAENVDLLTYCYELKKRMHNILVDGQTLMQSGSTSSTESAKIGVDIKQTFANALEPFIGLSSALLSSPQLLDETVACGGSGQQKRMGLPIISSKYQLMVDLAGEFGEEFAKIERPYDELQGDVATLIAFTHEVQRDLTLRKCIVDDKKMTAVLSRCDELQRRVAEHNEYVADRTPDLHQLWQEELDRVRRQQQLYRMRVEQGSTLRHQLALLTNATRQLVPFIMALSSTARAIDPIRVVQELDLAPMERICAQINALKVDATSRVDAIEKEERQRHERELVARRQADPKKQLREIKKQLKTTEVSVEIRKNKPKSTVEIDRERRFTTDLSSIILQQHRRQRQVANGQSDTNQHSHFSTIAIEGNLEDSLTRLNAESESSSRTHSRQSIIPPAPPPMDLTGATMSLPKSSKIDDMKPIVVVQPRTRGDNQSETCTSKEHLRPQSCTPGQLQAHDAMMKDIKERVARIDVKTPERELGPAKNKDDSK